MIPENVRPNLPNPTLEEANVLDTNVNFQILEVDGTVIIANDFNGTNFESLLSSVLYKVFYLLIYLINYLFMHSFIFLYCSIISQDIVFDFLVSMFRSFYRLCFRTNLLP